MIHAKNIVYSASEPYETTGRVTVRARLEIHATCEREKHEAINHRDEIRKFLRFALADALFADANRALTDLYMIARCPPLKDFAFAYDTYFEEVKRRFESARAALTIHGDEPEGN